MFQGLIDGYSARLNSVELTPAWWRLPAPLPTVDASHCAKHPQSMAAD
jgi:hypothetical protein